MNMQLDVERVNQLDNVKNISRTLVSKKQLIDNIFFKQYYCDEIRINLVKGLIKLKVYLTSE